MSKICSFLGVPFFQDTSAILGSAAPFQDAQIVGGAVLEAPTYCVPLFVWQSNKATLSFSSIKKKKKGKTEKKEREEPGNLYNRGMEPGKMGLPVIPHLLP